MKYNFNFLIQPISKMIKKSRQVLNILRAKRAFPANTKTSQRRRKSILFLVSKTSQIGLKWESQRPFIKTSSRRRLTDVLKTSSNRSPEDVFQETSSRPLPGDVLKTSKTSSRLFLVKAKDHLETIYGFSIQVRFKLLTYYHYIIRETN